MWTPDNDTYESPSKTMPSLDSPSETMPPLVAIEMDRNASSEGKTTPLLGGNIP